jgi:hypothetical protein
MNVHAEFLLSKRYTSCFDLSSGGVNMFLLDSFPPAYLIIGLWTAELAGK